MAAAEDAAVYGTAAQAMGTTRSGTLLSCVADHGPEQRRERGRQRLCCPHPDCDPEGDLALCSAEGDIGHGGKRSTREDAAAPVWRR